MAADEKAPAWAEVRTSRPERYRKQLAEHFRRKAEVSVDDDSATLHLADGDCRITCGDQVLSLQVYADTEPAIRRIAGVVGRHLERFGARDSLSVAWHYDE